MFPYQRGGVDVAGMGRRTYLCITSSVLNLGNSPQVPIVRRTARNKKDNAGKKSLAAKRSEMDSRPSHRQTMRLLSSAVIPEERGAFRKRFRKASKDQDGRCCDFVCQTPITVIAKAFGCEPFQLHSAADMFPGSQSESEFLNEKNAGSILHCRGAHDQEDLTLHGLGWEHGTVTPASLHEDGTVQTRLHEYPSRPVSTIGGHGQTSAFMRTSTRVCTHRQLYAYTHTCWIRRLTTTHDRTQNSQT
jgi:hypothetical protein